uniref:Uncharacterized protein n=1 Tax=Gopherus agassizii TaxID=38772 RepID=A0A452GFV0_9SAUR
DSHNGDQQGACTSNNINIFPPSGRRVKNYPRERRGKLMLARMETTLQKMEMPKQTRYSAGDFEILFFIKFYNNAEFCFTFF